MSECGQKRMAEPSNGSTAGETSPRSPSFTTKWTKYRAACSSSRDSAGYEFVRRRVARTG